MVTFTFKSLPGLISLNGAKYRLIFYFSKWVSRGYSWNNVWNNPASQRPSTPTLSSSLQCGSAAPASVTGLLGGEFSCLLAQCTHSLETCHAELGAPGPAEALWGCGGVLDLGQALVSAWKIDILYNFNVVKCIDFSYQIISGVTVIYL